MHTHTSGHNAARDVCVTNQLADECRFNLRAREVIRQVLDDPLHEPTGAEIALVLNDLWAPEHKGCSQKVAQKLIAGKSGDSNKVSFGTVAKVHSLSRNMHLSVLEMLEEAEDLVCGVTRGVQETAWKSIFSFKGRLSTAILPAQSYMREAAEMPEQVNWPTLHRFYPGLFNISNKRSKHRSGSW